mgnify:CR=1 FL=1
MYKNFVCVTDRKISRAPFLQQIETICALRPKALILREKDLAEAEYVQLAQKVQAVCENYGVKFIVHTFWRAGLALGADGVHLPLTVCTAMPAAERLEAGYFGVSVHSAEEAKAAIKFGAAYLIAGHIYESSCKEGVPPRGQAFLKEICTLSPVPVYAIGGIRLNKEQLEEVLACGAAGACVRSAFMQL